MMANLERLQYEKWNVTPRRAISPDLIVIPLVEKR